MSNFIKFDSLIACMRVIKRWESRGGKIRNTVFLRWNRDFGLTIKRQDIYLSSFLVIISLTPWYCRLWTRLRAFTYSSSSGLRFGSSSVRYLCLGFFSVWHTVRYLIITSGAHPVSTSCSDLRFTIGDDFHILHCLAFYFCAIGLVEAKCSESSLPPQWSPLQTLMLSSPLWAFLVRTGSIRWDSREKGRSWWSLVHKLWVRSRSLCQVWTAVRIVRQGLEVSVWTLGVIFTSITASLISNHCSSSPGTHVHWWERLIRSKFHKMRGAIWNKRSGWFHSRSFMALLSKKRQGSLSRI